VVSVASKRGAGGGPERYIIEEIEHERKVKKRRAKLVTAAEEAFTHIRRLKEHQHSSSSSSQDRPPMEPAEAAQAIFPTLSRPLQKYLRATRQQPQHSLESILSHLASCLSFDMSPRAFLEKYLVTAPVLQVQLAILLNGFTSDSFRTIESSDAIPIIGRWSRRGRCTETYRAARSSSCATERSLSCARFPPRPPSTYPRRSSRPGPIDSSCESARRLLFEGRILIRVFFKRL